MSEALIRALRSQFTPRMLALTLLPLAASLLVWLLLFVLFGNELLAVLGRSLGGLVEPLAGPDAGAMIESVVIGTGWFGMLLLFVPLVSVTALVMTAIVAMPLALSYVAARDYPLLERRGGWGPGSVVNAVLTTLVYTLLFIVTLPLWLIPLGALVVPLLLGAGLNARLFLADALAEHADRDELQGLRRQCRRELFGLGLVAALLQLVPVLNLVSPVYSGLSFIHFCLAALQHRRAAGRDISPLPLDRAR